MASSSGAGENGTFKPIEAKQEQNLPGYVSSALIFVQSQSSTIVPDAGGLLLGCT